MITTYHRHLFVFVIVFVFLLLLPVINCTSDQSEGTSIERKIRKTPAIKTDLYGILRKEKSNNNNNNNNEEEEEIKNLIKDFFKYYPYRRASSFHAMRGKRFIKTA